MRPGQRSEYQASPLSASSENSTVIIICDAIAFDDCTQICLIPELVTRCYIVMAQVSGDYTIPAGAPLPRTAASLALPPIAAPPGAGAGNGARGVAASKPQQDAAFDLASGRWRIQVLFRQFADANMVMNLCSCARNDQSQVLVTSADVPPTLRVLTVYLTHRSKLCINCLTNQNVYCCRST